MQRLRERVELSLDGRRAIALAVCALLLLGAVFSLGVMIGRKASSLQAPTNLVDDLAALDARAHEPDLPSPSLSVAKPVAADRSQVAPKPEPVRTAPSDPGTATVVPPPPRALQISPAAAVALTPPPRDLGEYTVQVGASRDRSEAARLEAKARGAGLRPYVVEANLGLKGTWYRVRVGAFPDKDSANRFRKDVERELRAAAAVMPTH
jgi:cell division septation protein DedD